MQDFVFITGNQHKADYLIKWLGLPVHHQRLELNELQSLDLHEVVEHKARQAFLVVKKPVLVEDVALNFTAMGRLPGTLIKLFLEEIGTEGLCRLADGLTHRRAEALIEYALFDGHKIHFFSGRTAGSISEKPRGHEGFGWNPIFIPNGSEKTFAEMVDEDRMPYSHRAEAVAKLRAFLQNA
jgi:non-canonical purine NTP pyrophosphatase (RdgB/HAM1 family)